MSMFDQVKSDLLLCTVYFHRLLRGHDRASSGSGAELSLLNNLEHWGGAEQSLTPKELAGYEQITQAAVSQLIKRMKIEGLVSVKKNPADSRSSLVSLSAKGRRQLARQGVAVKSVFDGVLSQLNAEELAVVAEAQSILSRVLTDSSEIQEALVGRGSLEPQQKA